MSHFSQSSPENAGVYVHEGTVIPGNPEPTDETAETGKENTPKITVAGKEYLYIKKGTVVSGIEDIPADEKVKKADSPSSQRKAIAKRKEAPKKITKDNLSVSAQNIRTQPEQNSLYAASLSGQSVGVTPGNHYQNSIFYHTVRYISAVQYNEYINSSYHYRYSVYSKSIIDGGGIRPPPFPC